MKRIIPIIAILTLSVTSALAIKVTLFKDVETLIRRSDDIVIAQCVSTQPEKGADRDGCGRRRENVVFLAV